MAMNSISSDILANLKLLNHDSSIVIAGCNVQESKFYFIAVHDDIMQVTIRINRRFMMRNGKKVKNPDYGFAEASARFLKTPGAYAAVDSKTLNWMYNVNLNEQQFSCAKVFEIMAKGRLLYERLTSLFNIPLEDIR